MAKVVIERVGRQITLTIFNTEESALAFKRLWNEIGFYNWGMKHLVLPKRTRLIGIDRGPLIGVESDSYELALIVLYHAMSTPNREGVTSWTIEYDSLPDAEKAFHDITRLLDDVMRQIAVAVRDLSQVSDETRTIEVNF